MAMIGKKDKPTYYNIVGIKSGAVLATVPKSQVLQHHKRLQAEITDEKLEIVLVIED